MKKSVCIVGGGASGMMAAIAAARAGACVTLLEQNDRFGKKIFMTGNGKCNLTNLNMAASFYDTTKENSFVQKILEAFGEKELLAFFEKELGMRTMVNHGSCIYPASESAVTVVDVLKRALWSNQVLLKAQTRVTAIRKTKASFEIVTDKGCICADRVILSCGGKSFPKTGSNGSGFALAKAAGLRLIPDYPALTALICQKAGMKLLAGLRQEAEVALYIDGVFAAKESGQLQFTDYGISGIPVFQISNEASRAFRDEKIKKQKKVKIQAVVNLFPNETKEEVLKKLKKQLTQFAKLPFEEAMCGFLHKKWIDYFGKECGFSKLLKAGEIPENKVEELAGELTAFTYEVWSVKGYDFCQVTGGGVSLGEIDEHMQAVAIPGLYVTGEMLDVIGRCGGYNLQWAFSTGMIAGSHAGALEAK